MDGGDAFTMDDGDTIGQRRMGSDAMDTIDVLRRQRQRRDGVVMRNGRDG